jgi:hypothetical protein
MSNIFYKLSEVPLTYWIKLPYTVLTSPLVTYSDASLTHWIKLPYTVLTTPLVHMVPSSNKLNFVSKERWI